MSHNLTPQEIEKLLNVNIITEYYSGVNSMSFPGLGHGKKILYSNGDEKGICPHCGSNNISIIGQWNHNSSVKTDLHKCNTCNAIGTFPGGSIRELMEKAEGAAGFTSNNEQNSQSNAQQNTSNTGPINFAYHEKQALDSIQSNTSSTTSAIYTLQSDIRILTETIKQLAQQNIQLMEKLATDPLVNIRKTVSEFSLK